MPTQSCLLHFAGGDDNVRGETGVWRIEPARKYAGGLSSGKPMVAGKPNVSRPNAGKPLAGEHGVG